MTRFTAPVVPYIEAQHKLGKQRPTAIELRLSETTSEAGAAFAIANTWHRTTSRKISDHYVVDEKAVYRCVYDNLISYGPPGSFPQKNLLTVRICDMPKSDFSKWFEEQPYAVLNNTAKLVAQLILAYKIPDVYLDETGFLKWRKWWRLKRHGGIYLNVKGAWPEQAFMVLVKKQLKELKR